MVQHYYRNVHAVVFVYDITNAASFRNLPAWIEECRQHALGNEVPRILVGNKCDLQDSVQVGTEVAQQFADTHSMPLFETSAKNSNILKDGSSRGSSDHVEAIFMTVAHKLRSQKPLVLSQPSDRAGGTVNLSSCGDSRGEGARSWGCSSCWGCIMVHRLWGTLQIQEFNQYCFPLTILITFRVGQLLLGSANIGPCLMLPTLSMSEDWSSLNFMHRHHRGDAVPVVNV